MREVREEIRRRYAEAADTTLGEAQDATSETDARRLKRIQRKGAWMYVHPSTFNGIDLGAQECRYSLFLRYIINSLDLPQNCDGCETAFSSFHVLDC